MNKEIKKVIEKEEVVIEKYEISGRVLDILKEFARSQYLHRKKYNILKLIINNGDNETTVDDISKEFNMSTPLIAYHINGNINTAGLIKNELITGREEKGKAYYKVTDYGKFIFEFAKIDDSLGKPKKNGIKNG